MPSPEHGLPTWARCRVGRACPQARSSNHSHTSTLNHSHHHHRAPGSQRSAVGPDYRSQGMALRIGPRAAGSGSPLFLPAPPPPPPGRHRCSLACTLLDQGSSPESYFLLLQKLWEFTLLHARLWNADFADYQKLWGSQIYHRTSLCLSFLICKKRTIREPALRVL